VDCLAGDSNGETQGAVEARLQSHTNNPAYGIIWRRLCLSCGREHIPRRNGSVGTSCEQTPRMAGPHGIGVRWIRRVPHFLVHPGSIRNKFKENSVAMQCAVDTSRWAYCDSFGDSHPFLPCSPNRLRLWRLRLPQDEQCASAGHVMRCARCRKVISHC